MINPTSKITLSLFLSVVLAAPVFGDPGDLTGNAVVPSVPEIAQQGYVLAFSDEFNGSALDATKWQYRMDTKGLSSNLPSNVSLSDGLLHIALKKEPANGKDYTSGGIISKEEFQYGYYEARFKCPPGVGWHTSFWTMHYNGKTTAPVKGREEIDICEDDSGAIRYHCGVHAWGASKVPNLKDSGKGVALVDVGVNFHVLGMEFTPQNLKFYLDGKLVNSIDDTFFVHTPGNIWLTSLGYGKKMDDSKLPAEAVFDYVRFFTKK